MVDTKGQMVGAHKGMWFYTIGQRMTRLRMTDDRLQE